MSGGGEASTSGGHSTSKGDSMSSGGGGSTSRGGSMFGGPAGPEGWPAPWGQGSCQGSSRPQGTGGLPVAVLGPCPAYLSFAADVCEPGNACKKLLS